MTASPSSPSSQPQQPEQQHASRPHLSPPTAPQVPEGYVLAPAPVKRRFVRRHPVLTVVGLVVAVVVVAQLAGGSGDDTPAATGTSTAAPQGAEDSAPAAPAAPDAAAPDAPVSPGIGTPVADGVFEFVVTGVEPGVARIGDEVLGVEAQGQFVLVRVTVTNVGDGAQIFDASSQTLLDAQGRTHSADSGSAVYLPDANSFLTSVNPGNTVDGIVVFDIPSDATPVSVELHDSPFSGGVTVAVG